MKRQYYSWVHKRNAITGQATAPNQSLPKIYCWNTSHEPLGLIKTGADSSHLRLMSHLLLRKALGTLQTAETTMHCEPDKEAFLCTPPHWTKDPGGTLHLPQQEAKEDCLLL